MFISNRSFIVKFLLIFTIIISFSVYADDANTQNLIIFYTNDLHGGITEQEADFLNPDFPPILGGGAAAANIIFKYRQKTENTDDVVLVLDQGDIFQGTPLGTKTEGQAIVEYMNEVRYDAVAAGNHDFDLGKEAFINLTKSANFPILAANIIDKKTGKVFSHVQPYTIIERKGLKIGLFGIATEATEHMSFPDHIEGLDFTSEVPAAQQAVDDLRAKGVDIVIAMVHMGLPYDTREGYEELQQAETMNVRKQSYLNAMELANQVTGIDILFGGHIHRGYQEPWEDPVNHTLCFQNYGNGGNLGMTSIQIDKETKTIMGYELPGKDGGLLLLSSDEFWPDKDLQKQIREKQAVVEKGYDEIIGVTETDLVRSSREDSPMSNLICDAIMAAGDADFSFSNFGGIRANISIGAITPRDIFKVLPFGNSVVVINMKGSFLMQLMESKLEGRGRGLAIGGGIIEYDNERSDGNKIVRFEIGGSKLDPNKTYRVATSDYLAEGNSGLAMIKEIDESEIARTGILLRAAVTEFVQKNTPLNFRGQKRMYQVSSGTSRVLPRNFYGFEGSSLNFLHSTENQSLASAGLLIVPETMPDPEIDEFAVNPVIGETFLPLDRSLSGESALNNFVCDIMLNATGADLSILNFNDIHADLPPGQIRHLDMFRLFPFSFKMMVVELSGQQIIQLIESKISGVQNGFIFGGATIEFDLARKSGNRLVYCAVGQYPLYPDKTYRVVTTDYNANGNAGFDIFKSFGSANFFNTEIVLRDAVTQFIKNNSPINYKTDGRLIKK